MAHSGEAPLDPFLGSCRIGWDTQDFDAGSPHEVLQRSAELLLVDFDELLNLPAGLPLPQPGKFQRKPGSARSCCSKDERMAWSSHGWRHPSTDLPPDFANFQEEVVHENPALLRRKIRRGMVGVEEAAAEAKRRNKEVTRCLAEVRTDIKRISERMKVVKQDSRHASTPRARTAATRSGGVASELSGCSAALPRASRAASAVPPAYVPAGRRVRPSSLLRGRVHDTSRLPPSQPCPLSVQVASPEMNISQSLAEVQDTLRVQLLSARGSREEEQRALVKKLMVKWHPDRHPENIELATSAFQFIQQEKDRILGL